MRRSATVLIVPVLSLLLAAAFAPNAVETSAAVPDQMGPATATDWFISFVSRPPSRAEGISSDICNDEMLDPAPAVSPIDMAERLLFR